MTDKRALVPFLKWPGGKRWFIARYSHLLPEVYGRYIEPFLGAGSVFFHLQPERAVLGDTNADLIYAYRSIREEPARFEAVLRDHQRNHGTEYYYRVRDEIPGDPVHRAARLVYLNRTCFNGIYRVNLQGQFNVPKGAKDAVILDSDDFLRVSGVLANAILRVDDFEPLIDEARAGDLVFADPPYTVQHNNNAFVKYNERLFSWDDQIRLADALARARGRGVRVVATNASHESVRELYAKRGFALQVVHRSSTISATASSRGRFEELVVTST